MRSAVRPQLLFRRSVLPLQVLPHNTGRTSDEFDAGALFVIFGRPFRRHGFLLAAGEPQQFAADDRTVLGAEPLGELLYERVGRGFGLPGGRIGAGCEEATCRSQPRTPPAAVPCLLPAAPRSSQRVSILPPAGRCRPKTRTASNCIPAETDRGPSPPALRV